MVPWAEDGSASAERVVGSVWRGDGGLAGAQGRLQQRAYRRALQALGWRELGVVLARLSRALAGSVPEDGGRRAAWVRTACALAGAVTHMQAEGGDAPVNAAFVTDMVRTMVRAAAASGSVAQAVLHAVAGALSAPSRSDGRPPPFAGAAVLDGLLAGGGGGGQRDPEPTAKRRRAAATEGGQRDPPDDAALLRLLADTLGDAALSDAHRHGVRILRAQDGALVARAAAHGGADVAAELARVAQALMDRGCAMLGPDSDDSEAFAGDLFACIRDTAPFAAAAAAGGSAARLARALVAQFQAPIAAPDPGALYGFCAEQRRRCYQWAALCRVGTWLAGQGERGAADAVEPAAECGRLCWLQILATAPGDCSTAAHNVWCLLLRESLGHIAPPEPARPLCAGSSDAQAQVFQAVPRLVARIIRGLAGPPEQQRGVGLPLLQQSLHVCRRLLRTVAPHAATMEPCSAPPPGGDSFGQRGGAPADYIFRPRVVVAAGPAGDEAPDLDTEEARSDADEAARETQLGAVVTAFADVAAVIADDSSAPEEARAVAAQAFRVALQWIEAFATAARDTAGEQARRFEARQRVNIGLVDDRARLVGLATDWTRLQRIPLVRAPGVAPADDDPHATFKPAAVRALLVLAALPVSVLLGDEAQPALARCLARDAGPGAAELALRLSRRVETLLPGRGHQQAAFAALRVLASILGVPSYVAATSIDRLRLPSVQPRSRNPASTEALMQLAMQLGLCRLLLDPALLAALVGRVRDGRVLRSPLALCAEQLWLDMIGATLRHSLFRTYTGAGAGPTDGQRMPFTTWWALALALGTRCLTGVLADSSAGLAQVRAACILPAHLLSWHPYLPISEGSARAFATTAYSTHAGVDLAEFRSVVAVLYFLATRLWTAVPALSCCCSAADAAAMRLCRDVWGIASDALSLLRRLAQYPPARALLAAPGHIAGLGGLLPGILDRSGVPQLVRDLTHACAAPAVADYAFDVEDRPDLLPFPVVGIDDPGGPPSEKSSQETDIAAAADDAASSDGDVVDKLLHESARLRSIGQRPRMLDEYFSARMLGPLWAAHIDELLRLPSHVAFGPPGGCEPNLARTTERLTDHADMLYSMLTPLLAVRASLAAPAALWAALAAAVPPCSIRDALEETHLLDARARMCVPAALVLPELATAEPQGAASIAANSVVRCLVLGAVDDDDGDLRARCTAALLFFTWRQRRQLAHHVAAAAKCLQVAADEMLGELARNRTLLTARGLAGDRQGLPADAHSDLVALAGRPGGPSAVTSMQFLARYSPVFRAMFTGAFAEARAAQQGARRFDLQCGDAALAALVAILHRCVFAAHPSQVVDGALTIDEAVSILELALYYDLQPAIIALLAHVCAALAAALAADSPPALEPATLDRLALMHAERWDHHLPATDPTDSAAACSAAARLLAAVTLLHLDAVDVPAAIGPDPEPFALAAVRLFEEPSDLRILAEPAWRKQPREQFPA
ncbi:hypothetical protein H4R21_000337 [Coemansia helicoidea]|uniref:Uncharacterized protein n=1 Tax=Coemansia helicoidea TaxID=1286919 RepID=A0ACC1LG59_9FUNG|nr:hypothetical protein H4R21_000337 [Coemansia helicoidea]